jgi:prepilin signal peptidase PulO-like enzyme (type II secretory pathway)
MGFVLGLLLLTYFAIVVVIDVEHRLILRPTSIFGALLALGLGWWLHGLTLRCSGRDRLWHHEPFLLSRRLITARACRLAAGWWADDEEALGGGDVTLAAILGLLGCRRSGLPLGKLLGGIVGLIIVVVSLVQGHYGRKALMLFMPYGPAFVLSAFLIMFLPGLVAGLLPQ